ncbi:MAG: glycosyltransferase family 39 protein [bacterium]|nr:glycosyltransferase family 39 protein [bacterium]
MPEPLRDVFPQQGDDKLQPDQYPELNATQPIHVLSSQPTRSIDRRTTAATQLNLPNRSTSKTVIAQNRLHTPVVQEGRGLTAAIDSMLSASEQDAQIQIHAEHLVCIFLLGLIFFIRATNLNFNTLHLDEAIYTTVGEEILSGVTKQGATRWMYGSYLYPIQATLAEHLGGVIGLRLLSAVFSTITALFVFLTTRRVFNTRAGLLALFVFGFTGISINVGQHATYDVVSLPFLSMAVYFAVSAILRPERQQRYLLWAGFAFSLCVLGKYIAILMLPALILTMLTLHLARGRGLWSFITRIPWWHLIAPMLIILGIYGAYYVDDLRQAFSEGYAFQAEPRMKIIGNLVRDLGLIILLAMVAVVVILWKAFLRMRSRPGLLIAVICLLPILLIAILLPALYHLVTANGRSMWKHNVYSLIFLAPIVGYGIAEFIDFLRSSSSRSARTGTAFRVLSAGLTVLLLLLFITEAFRQNTSFHRLWPNTSSVVSYLSEQGITPENRILSSGYSIYDYYFDFGVRDQNVWNNIWYAEYNNLTGREAVRQGIQDCAFDLVVLDNFWDPQWAGELAYVAQDAGYVVGYSTMEEVSTGDQIVTQVYLPQCRSES